LGLRLLNSSFAVQQGIEMWAKRFERPPTLSAKIVVPQENTA
jgi:hypothetical protein